MKTIRAKVNPRLLTKASRLFTGTLDGRVIEILQNARRAGATQVIITNRPDGMVVVHDNGRGVEDFEKLLDLGGSGWDEDLEASEDPAGVGLFCLAPRQLSVRSRGQIVSLTGNGWVSGDVVVYDDKEPVEGTILYFPDDPWTSEVVNPHAVFSGLQVTVDGQACPSLSFISEKAAAHPELGCRIQVLKPNELDAWHYSSNRGRYHTDNVLMNFHGQVISFADHPVSETDLHFLVDLTGEPTGIRMMLPARTQLVQNEAFAQLKAAMKLEAFRYLQQRGHHRLRYKEYLEARQLGIELPEAQPTFRVGLLAGEGPEPIEVAMPDGFPLAQCYRFNPDADGEETDETNAHLLAALGEFKQPFVPVDIASHYDGYGWAKLPTIDQVELNCGKILHEADVWSGWLACVDSLSITVRTSDGKTWSAPVCIAVRPSSDDKDSRWWDHEVLVTPDAREHVADTAILYHLGGYSDEGDTYETQEWQFGEQLDEFWDLLLGPDETLRRSIVEQLRSLTKWKTVTVHANGRIVIKHTSGKRRVLSPPGQRKK